MVWRRSSTIGDPRRSPVTRRPRQRALVLCLHDVADNGNRFSAACSTRWPRPPPAGLRPAGPRALGQPRQPRFGGRDGGALRGPRCGSTSRPGAGGRRPGRRGGARGRGGRAFMAAALVLCGGAAARDGPTPPSSSCAASPRARRAARSTTPATRPTHRRRSSSRPSPSG